MEGFCMHGIGWLGHPQRRTDGKLSHETVNRDPGGRETKGRVLRRSGEVYGECKGSEMNWVNVLWFPMEEVVNIVDERLSKAKLTQWTRRMS